MSVSIKIETHQADLMVLKPNKLISDLLCDVYNRKNDITACFIISLEVKKEMPLFLYYRFDCSDYRQHFQINRELLFTITYILHIHTFKISRILFEDIL